MALLPQLHDSVKKKTWARCKQLLHAANLSIEGDQFLQYAAFMGDVEMVTILLKNGVDINFKTDFGMSALHFAVSCYSEEVIELLPKNSDDGFNFKYYEACTDNYLVDSRWWGFHKTVESEFLHELLECNYIDNTTFYVQTQSNKKSKKKSKVKNCDEFKKINFHGLRESNINVIELLLNSGSTVNSKLRDGRTPLHLAVECGHIDNLNCLLNYSSDVNSICFIDNINGFTPLHLASRTNECIIERLIVCGANVNASATNGKTPLHLAVEFGLINNVKTLLKHDANVFETCVFDNENGFTPLHLAMKNSNKDITDLLLNSNAEINATTQTGNTALHLALLHNQLDNVKTLLKYEPDLMKSRSSDSYTPLHVAAENSSAEALALLLNAGVMVDLRTENGKTPLMLAVIQEKINNVDMLLKHWSNVNAICTSEEEEGFTPLHFAAKGNDHSIVEMLINHGADYNAWAKNGKTPLHLSIEYNRAENIACILKHNPDVSIRKYEEINGYTPLHYAAIRSNVEIIEQILNAGADIDAVTKMGKTSLNLAVEYCKVDNVKALLQHKAEINLPYASGDLEGYTRYSFIPSDSSNKIIEQLLENKNERCVLHFFVEKSTLQTDLDIVLKYKPLHNCTCNAQNFNTVPIHFAVKGCQEKIFVAFEPAVKTDSNNHLYYSLNYFKNKYFTGLTSYISKYDLNNCSCSSPYSEGYTPLLVASKTQNREITETLIKMGANVNIPTLNHESALYLAVKHGSIENVHLLIRHNCAINYGCTLANNTGYSPLHCAASRPNSKILKLLLQNGADVNQATSNGHTPLFPAVVLGITTNIKNLLENKIDVHNVHNKSAFFHALLHGKANTINAFKNYGFTINTLDSVNIDLLQNSIIKKQHIIYYEFMKFVINVNIVFNSGDSLLHLACKYNNDRVFKDLLKRNIDVNMFDKNGNTAVHILTQDQRINLLDELLQHGVDINIKNNKNGQTALVIACRKYDPLKPETENCIKILLQYNADPNVVSNLCDNSLCLVTGKHNSYPIVKLLLECGADVNIKGNDKNSPLHVACQTIYYKENQPEKYIELLLSYGAEVNALNSSYNTPLHIACIHYLNSAFSKLSVDKRITTLLEYGADLTLENYSKCTPVQIFMRYYEYYRSNNRNIPERFTNTVTCILKYLAIKNQSPTGLSVIEQIAKNNYLSSEEVPKLCEKLNNFLKECEREICRLKNEFNIGDLNLFEMLTSCETKSVDMKTLEEYNLVVKFPIYSDIMINNIKNKNHFEND